jgi:hypothetical protein
MSIPSSPAPSTAERVRSVCVRATAAMLAVDGFAPVDIQIHHLLDDGAVAVAAAADGDIARTVTHATGSGCTPAAVLELTDHAPLPVRRPVRSLVWFRGRLRRVPAPLVPALLDVIAGDPAMALMWLQTESVVVADAAGAESVGLDDLLAARPDPFCAMESSWLQHIDGDHREVVDLLASRLPPLLRRGRVRPLGLDRYGLCLRVERDDGDHDVRLPFAAPVTDLTGLGRAIRVLLGCPFLNGLRARRV